MLLDGFWLKKLCAQDILHLDNVFCIISQSPRLHCHWSAQTWLSVHLMPQIMRPRSDRESAVDSVDEEAMNEFTSEISRLRRKGSHADLELEWSVLSWETGSQGEPINQQINCRSSNIQERRQMIRNLHQVSSYHAELIVWVWAENWWSWIRCSNLNLHPWATAHLNRISGWRKKQQILSIIFDW